jgi:acetylornithine deacetylase
MQPCIAQKGLLILKLTARGRTAHAARAEEGENAIVAAMRDIAALERLVFHPDHPELGPVTCNVTVIEGGTARNVIPDACTFWLDIRSTPSWPHDTLIAHIADAVASEVHVHSKRLIPVGTPASERIVQAVLAADPARVPFGSPTLSDWIHLAPIPTVKIGPGDSRLSHTPREHVRMDELESATAGYASIIRQYFST